MLSRYPGCLPPSLATRVSFSPIGLPDKLWADVLSQVSLLHSCCELPQCEGSGDRGDHMCWLSCPGAHPRCSVDVGDHVRGQAWHHTAACPCSPEGPSASALTPAARLGSAQLKWESRTCLFLFPKPFLFPPFRPPSPVQPPGPPAGPGRRGWEGAVGTERGTQHFCCSHAAPYADAGEDLDTLPGLYVGCRHESQPPAERRMLAEPAAAP